MAKINNLNLGKEQLILLQNINHNLKYDPQLRFLNLAEKSTEVFFNSNNDIIITKLHVSKEQIMYVFVNINNLHPKTG